MQGLEACFLDNKLWCFGRGITEEKGVRLGLWSQCGRVMEGGQDRASSLFCAQIRMYEQEILSSPGRKPTPPHQRRAVRPMNKIKEGSKFMGLG